MKNMSLPLFYQITGKVEKRVNKEINQLGFA